MMRPNEADEKPLAPLAGVIALSTYIPSQQMLAEEASEANRATPIFTAHGTEDNEVALEMGTLRPGNSRNSAATRSNGKEYPMPHAICLEARMAKC